MLNDIKAYQSVLDALPNAVFMKDAQHRFVFLNSLACELFGRPASEVLGKSDFDFFPAEQARGFWAMDDQVFSTGLPNETEELITDHEGVTHTLITRKTLVEVRGERYMLACVSDVTALRESEAQIRYLAYHDTLTGLPNRRMLYDHLNQVVARAATAEAPTLLMIVDLDGFKNVNDSYGHQAGDALLREFGRRMKAAVRAEDLAVRMGGDEFAVLAHNMPGEEDANAACARVAAAASEPFDLGGVRRRVRASVGAVLTACTDASSGELVRKADTALYEAKRRRKGSYCLYTPELDASLAGKRAMERDLIEALSKSTGLSCRYQPLMNTEKGVIAGVEALARWDHPTLGSIAPAQFIPLAEECGLIRELDDWIMRRACREMRAWTHLSLALNISAIHLRDPGYAAHVLNVAAQEGFPVERLELEITEAAVVNADAVGIAQIKQLRAHGVRISLDDFGTGYSSLRLLKDLEIDKVKIDQSFVQFVTTAQDSAAIVRALAHLAATLGLQVVAEGVETRAQSDFLLEAGCTGMQGFLFSRPVPAEELAALLDRAPAAAGGPTL